MSRRFGFMVHNTYIIILFVLPFIKLECLQEEFKFVVFNVNRLISFSFSNMLAARMCYCALLCYEDIMCSGYAYNPTTLQCYLYNYDITIATNMTNSVGMTTYKSNLVCGEIPSIANGTPSLLKSTFNPGVTASYQCADGSYLNSSSQARCLTSGRWSNSNIACVFVKTCHEAKQLGVDVSSVQMVKPDATSPAVNVKCEVRSDGVHTIFVCGAIPPIANGTPSLLKSTFNPGVTASYQCADGSYLNSSSQARCLTSGKWSNPNIACEFVKTCHEAKQLGVDVSSVQMVKPDATSPAVNVKCEVRSDGVYTIFVKTCHEAKQLGIEVPPVLMVKPDVMSPAVNVKCEVRSDGVYTIIGHNLANRTSTNGYEAKRSFAIPVIYDIPLQLAIRIADISTDCQQYMRLECFGVRAVPYNGFKTRHGQIADYFIGGVKGQNNCECDIYNSCAKGKVCNCNANDAVQRQDEGYNRYKDDLPITAFLAGDTGQISEDGKITIGSLQCKN